MVTINYCGEGAIFFLQTLLQQIFAGQLDPNSCVGEVLIHSGMETHPYTITTSTPTKLGWLSSTTIKEYEIQKHILSDRKLTLPILTEVRIVAINN